MEKKTYETPAIEVVELPETPSLLQASKLHTLDDGEAE
jgi:hypothetical protein